MKKNFVIVVVLLIAANLKLSAQAYKEGDKLINLGIGVGTPFFGSGYKSTIPINPTITWEKSFSDIISVGGTISYAASKYSYNYVDAFGNIKINDIKYTAIFLGARGSYHFALSNEKFDPYVGGGLGYVILTASNNEGYMGGAASGIGFTFYAGGRYYLAKKISLYSELGYASLSFLNVGISLKM